MNAVLIVAVVNERPSPFGRPPLSFRSPRPDVPTRIVVQPSPLTQLRRTVKGRRRQLEAGRRGALSSKSLRRASSNPGVREPRTPVGLRSYSHYELGLAAPETPASSAGERRLWRSQANSSAVGSPEQVSINASPSTRPRVHQTPFQPSCWPQARDRKSVG